MYHIVIHRHGGPEVLTREPLLLPPLSHNQIRVRQTAIGVNFIDTYHRSGSYPQRLPFTPGTEGSGVVEAIGEGVHGVSVSDRIVYITGSGTYASHVQIGAESAVRIPDGVDDAEAAAVFLKGLTAWMLLFEIRPARPRDTALVWAPVGGVGSLLVPWAASLGVRVIAATSSKEKADRALALGATDALTSRTGVAAAVRELTNGVGVDVAYDSVGAASQEESLASLKPRGLWVSYGNASGMVAPVAPGRLAMGGSLMMTRPSLFHFITQRRDLERGAQALFGALRIGTLKARIGMEMSLSEAAQAQRALEAGETTGSLILRP